MQIGAIKAGKPLSEREEAAPAGRAIQRAPTDPIGREADELWLYHRALHRWRVHAEEQRRILAYPIKPHAAAGITVTIPEWHQPDVRSAPRAEHQVRGHKLSFIADRDGAEGVGSAVFTAQRHVRAIAAGLRRRGRKS